MFSVNEHGRLVAIISKRNPRIRQKHNPEYPMTNLIRHYECKHEEQHSKFSGFAKDRGSRNGKKRPKKPTYRCRTCRKEYSRQKLHDSIDIHLSSLRFLPDDTVFKRALIKVWRNQRGSVVQRISALEANQARIENDIRNTIGEYSKEPEGAVKKGLRLLIENYDKQLEAIKTDITSTQNIDMESEDFVKFAMNFTEQIKERWWSITFDERKGGEQILFNGKFYIDNSAKVHTPKLSTIYRLGTNKNDPNGVDFNKMVELVGTAPTSASLIS